MAMTSPLEDALTASWSIRERSAGGVNSSIYIWLCVPLEEQCTAISTTTPPCIRRCCGGPACWILAESPMPETLTARLD